MANSNILKRKYGSNINTITQNVLKRRQDIAKAPQPGESLGSYKSLQSYNTTTTHGVGGMSSKTPFIRMWSSITPVVKTETDETFSLTSDEEATISTIAEAKDKENGGKYDNQGVKYNIESGKIYKLEKSKEQQIIMLGDNSYYNLINKTDNQFMKPQAGIISLTSETIGELGAIKSTQVTFRVYNFKEYQEIYQRYFLKPGALIFVDFGSNMVGGYNDESPNSLYNPEDLLKAVGGPNTFLYGDITKEASSDELGWSDRALGHVETVWGKVINYESDMNEDGSFTCKVEIKSANTSLAGSVNTDVNKWVSEQLDSLVDMYLINTGKKIPEGLAEEFTYTWKQRHSNEWFDGRWSAFGGSYKDRGNFVTEGEENIKIDYDFLNEKFDILGQASGVLSYTPLQDSIKWGIFSLGDDNWIQIHALEDMIFNPLFAFSKNLKGVRDSENSEVSFDSSFQETHWTSLNMMHQYECGGYECSSDGFPIIYPYVKLPGEWKHLPEKYKTIDDAIKGDDTFNFPDSPSNDSDPDIKQIPVGQLFVNFNLVTQAFNETDPGKEGTLNVLDVYRNLLSKINEKTGYTDFKLTKNPKEDTIWNIIDLNFLGLTTEESSYEKLFEFDITSQNSITQDVKLTFNMPSDNISNMIAISGNSGGRGFSSLDRLSDEAICTELAHSFLDAGIINNVNEVKDFFTIYSPELESDDTLLQQQMSIKGNFQTSLQDVFATSMNDVMKKRDISKRRISNEAIEKIIKLEYEKDDALTLYEDGSYKTDATITMMKPQPIQEDPRSIVASKQEKLVREAIQEYMEKEGSSVSGDIHTYYKKQLSNKMYSDVIDTILPMSLSMTIDGISGLDYGNLFKINYLPKTFKNKVFFQVTKVSHDVSPSGWKTSLDTQFRFDRKVKEVTSKTNKYKNHYLDIEFLRKSITHGPSLRAIPFHNLLKLKPLSDYGVNFLYKPTNQIQNYTGIYEWEARFDIDNENSIGYRMKDKDTPDVPDSIYNPLPKDELTDEGYDKNNESFMFLYGSVFRKKEMLYTSNYADAKLETFIDGDVEKQVWDKVTAKTENIYIKFEEMKQVLSEFPNFLIEKVDQTADNRFLIALQLADEASVDIFMGLTADKKLEGTSTGANDILDTEAIAFYPSIPHNEKQLCVQFQGKMVWIPMKKYVNKSEEEKKKIITSLHMFLINEFQRPMQVYDNVANEFLSRFGGFAKDVEVGKKYDVTPEGKAEITDDLIPSQESVYVGGGNSVEKNYRN